MNNVIQQAVLFTFACIFGLLSILALLLLPSEMGAGAYIVALCLALTAGSCSARVCLL